MMAMIAFWSSHLVQELDNFLGGPIQTAEGVGGLSLLTLGYRHLNCHRHRCWRLGRHPHGPYKLCSRHHPATPDSGRITQEHIDSIGAKP